MRKKTAIIFIALLSLSLLSACLESNPEIDMNGFNEPGHIKYSFTRFTGIQLGEIEAEDEQVIDLSVTAGVVRGRLLMQVMSPSQELMWDVILEENVNETVQIPVTEDGVHMLIIRGLNARGSFDVQWEVTE